MTNIIRKIAIVQSQNLTIGETAVIKSKKILIVTKKETPSKLSNQDFNIGTSKLNFPPVLGTQLATNHSSVDVAMVEWKANPYEILSKSKVISNIISISILSNDGKTLKVDNLETPMALKLDTKDEIIKNNNKRRRRKLLLKGETRKKSVPTDDVGSTIQKQNDNTIYINCTHLTALKTNMSSTSSVNDGGAYLYDNENRFISDADILQCHLSSTIFYYLTLSVGLIFLIILMYRRKTIKDGRRRVAFSQGIFLTLFVIAYVITILLTCSNTNVLPRFLHGFSVIILGMCVSGAIVALAVIIILISYLCTSKVRRVDTCYYIDWPIYITLILILPVFIFSIVLWGRSVALSDMLRGETDAMNYYPSTNSFFSFCKDVNKNISFIDGNNIIIRLEDKEICKYWDTTSNSWSSTGCITTGDGVCKCNHLTDFAKTLKKSGQRLDAMFDSPLDALRAHWGVPLTLSILFGGFFIALISTAVIDTYTGRRFKMEGALFVALLAIARMRRRVRKKK